MSHSLRCRLKDLRYKKILTDRELERLCKALDNEKVLEQIRAEIEALPRELPTDARNMVRRTRVLDIIDRHMKGADE